jgi:hypothetical protein
MGVGIEKVKYGEVHLFYPLRFETNNRLENFTELVKKSKVLFTEEYQNEILSSLGFSASQIVKDLQENFTNNEFIFKAQDLGVHNTINPNQYNLDDEDIELELEDTGSSLKVNFFHKELEELQQQIYRLSHESYFSSQFYGNKFISLQRQFVLLPLKIELSNGENVWLTATLYIFANGMGYLKMQFPLIDIGIEPLMENDLNNFIKKVINKWRTPNDTLEPSLSDIADFYIKSLAEDTCMDLRIYNDPITYITLIDFEGIPKQMGSVPNEVQEDLFRIIAAPVPNTKSTSYSNTARDYIKANSWGDHNIKYVVKTTGGCLSFIDNALLDEYKSQNSISCMDNSDYSNLASNVFFNVKFALSIIILKKLNFSNCYYEKVNGLGDLSKIQKEYNKNILFICDLQEECFGTVSEQTEFFESRMCHYLKQNIVDKKLAAIDSIINDEEKKKDEKFQNFLAIGGFIVTLLFGLSAIFDTIVIIRKVFAFIPYNVPVLTLENSSFLLWVILNVIILFKIVKMKKNR